MLKIGPGVILQHIYQLPECPALLQKSLTKTTTWPERNQITVEQTIRSPHIAPLWLGALMVLGTRVTASAASEEFTLAEFLASQNKHLEISSLWLPLTVPGFGWGLAQVSRTPADAPAVAAVAFMDLHAGVVHQVRLALAGVWPEPVRLAQAAQLLINEPVPKEKLRAVSISVMNEVSPASDYLGTAVYRKEMAGLLTQRALAMCIDGVDQS